MPRKVTGTYEWAVATVNCSIRCSNGCKFCYARRLAILQKRIKSLSEWAQGSITHRKISKEKKKYPGTVMFPSIHDIHEDNLEVCIEVISNLLEAGNKVLITSKPKIYCIKEICEVFKHYKDKILFRFTIGTSNNRILKTWEPGASRFEERFKCLQYAESKGFRTSISMEPMLDSDTVVQDAKKMLPFVTDSLWIGKMNKIDDRVAGVSKDEIERIKRGQTKEGVYRIYNALKDEPKIRWKESFKQDLGLELVDEPGLDK